EAGSGTITMLADGDLTVSGELNAASGGNGLGGDITLNAAAGDVLLSGPVDVTAGIGGGTIDVAAAGSVMTLAINNARLDAKATGAEGDGGSVDVTAMAGDVVLNVPIAAQGTTGLDIGGSGGDVMLDALHGSVQLNAAIDLSGAVPDGDGGDLDVSAGLDVTQ